MAVFWCERRQQMHFFTEEELLWNRILARKQRFSANVHFRVNCSFKVDCSDFMMCVMNVFLWTCKCFCCWNVWPRLIHHLKHKADVFVSLFIRWFFALMSVSGLFSVTFSVIFAYVADITEENERSTAYGLVRTPVIVILHIFTVVSLEHKSSHKLYL